MRYDDPESRRLALDETRAVNWKRWGAYLPERQWATVREDYSADGDVWRYFPHEQARSRAYRWGEDGLLGLTDRQCRLCFAVALWNERDPILKERLFGLTNGEGNHGEDAKELWYYLDATPSGSYLKALYKYPQREFPYELLLRKNRERPRSSPEYELLDTGIFDDNRYFDVLVEYAKASPEDVLVQIRVFNRGPEDAPIHVLPHLWFRNTWAWGRTGEGYWPKPTIGLGHGDEHGVRLWTEHSSLGRFELSACPDEQGRPPAAYFTENETNTERLWGVPNKSPYVKDAIHERVVGGRVDAVNPANIGTKAALHYRAVVPAGGSITLKLRLHASGDSASPGVGELLAAEFEDTFVKRRHEADLFHAARTPKTLSVDEARVVRQARAGLLFTKQFYWYVVKDWREGDPGHPKPPRRTRNRDWRHLYNRDVISVPDKWEYPWYASWDLAFHMIPMAELDPTFAKQQLVLFCREWYMHPNGQLPAYEFNFSDVNPPVFAWAAWRTFKTSAPKGERDRVFLAQMFAKLVINFTWWVNRKDEDDDNLFSGGFLGLDNIGVFDRSKPLPTGGRLAQADGTAWMAFYAAQMLTIAFELADVMAIEDLASKFFEHFIHIADAMNGFGGTGLWDEQDGFYYDQIEIGGHTVPLRVRSMVGLIPLFTADVLEESVLERLPNFKKRMEWLLKNRSELAQTISYMETPAHEGGGHRLLAIPTRERLVRALKYVLDEEEFLSPYGVRSLSRVHEKNPYVFRVGDEEYRVDYAPGDAETGMFGGNSNWRGPIWLPLNYLLIEALERYDFFYGDTLLVECPTGSGRYLRLKEVAREIAERISRLFLPGEDGAIPSWGRHGERMSKDEYFNRLIQFHEYFHADKGWGCGAEHQTGWTSLVVGCIGKVRAKG